jgi:ABC-2 type transport system permease protein
VNWEHFKAFVWLRWRLLYNQNRKAGVVNAVLTMIVFVGALLAVIPLFIGCFMLGLYAIPKAQPTYLMYAWDGIVVVFLFFWMIGLITELQRTDPLSLSKFMHLPVSPNGAFLINYLSSLLRLSLIMFVPVMLAFALALLVVKGFSMLLVLPLLAAFVLMVTALTYQFQGWLASLMSNPRRRRTVIMVTTLTFVLIVQLPNLLNFLAPWGPARRGHRAPEIAQELQQLNLDAQAGRINANQLARRQQEIFERQRRIGLQANRESLEQIERTARFVNMALPIGWLPLGVVTAAEGSVLPSLLGLLGMTLIGSVSLFRAYRTTIGMYQGASTRGKGRPAPAKKAATDTPGRKPRTGLLETHLPGLSEPVSAVALAGFRSLLRAPEAKMMLLSPIIMSVIFGSMLWRTRNALSEPVRPLVAIGGMGFVLLGVVQLMSNQFGFDRDGFRVFVLSSARRRDILIGKNLSFAPLILGMAVIILVALQAVSPMTWDHVLAMVPQYVSMFLVFCLLMNLLSIYAPVYVAAGSLKPSNPKLTTVLLHLVTFTVLFPLTQGFLLIPLGAETVLHFAGIGSNLPICLLLTLLECALVVVIYYFGSDGLGSLLQSREQKILETVTAKAA